MITNMMQRLQESWGYGPRPVKAAKLIAGFINDLAGPDTAIDIGAGSGALVIEMRKLGINARGYDIAPSIPHVAKLDLTSPFYSIPHADVITCIEVAEHISPEHGDRLVEAIAEADPEIIVFAAGIPLQGGWHHVNEQWASYWAERFWIQNYDAHDDLRTFLWDTDVAPWYAQDTLIYATKDVAAKYGLHKAEVLDVVHPRTWERIGPMGIWKRLWTRRHSYSLSLRRLSEQCSSLTHCG